MKIGENYLTVERAKELLTPHYLHDVLMYHPGFSKLVPGVEDESFVGAIDCHAHVGPDFIPRAETIFEYGKKALRRGMRAITLKNHYHVTSPLAEAAEVYLNEYAEREGLPNRIEIYGDICLNFGLDPFQVELALRYKNTKIIRMPSFQSVANQRAHGKDKGLSVLDCAGKIKPEVETIFDMAKSKNIGICSGHLGPNEQIAMAAEAAEKKVPFILNHVIGDNSFYHMNLEQIKEACRYDYCYLGIYAMQFLPSFYAPVRDPWALFQAIDAVSPEKCIIASDSGQILNWPALEGTIMLVRALIGYGYSQKQIDTMFKVNPAILLGLPVQN